MVHVMVAGCSNGSHHMHHAIELPPKQARMSCLVRMPWGLEVHARLGCSCGCPSVTSHSEDLTLVESKLVHGARPHEVLGLRAKR